MAFHLWISHLDRLPVRALLYAWGIITTDLFCTCNSLPETRDHLLLHCDFSEQVWRLVLHRLGQPNFIFANWSVLFSWLRFASANVSNALKLVAVHITIYFGKREIIVCTTLCHLLPQLTSLTSIELSEIRITPEKIARNSDQFSKNDFPAASSLSF